MCVQYRLDPDCPSLAEFHNLEGFAELSWKPRIFPRYRAPVIVQRDLTRKLELYHFGLIPSFEHEAKPKKVFHNARSETLLEKPSFRLPFQRSRCLVPMSAFFEFLPVAEKKSLHEFRPTNSVQLLAAGIINFWKSPTGEVLESFAVVTKGASEQIHQAGHDRVPVFLDPPSSRTWLSPDEPSEELLKLLAKSLTPDFLIASTENKTKP